jgi:hypothetical protein
VSACSVTAVAIALPTTAVVVPLSIVVTFIIPRPHGMLVAS